MQKLLQKSVFCCLAGCHKSLLSGAAGAKECGTSPTHSRYVASLVWTWARASPCSELMPDRVDGEPDCRRRVRICGNLGRSGGWHRRTGRRRHVDGRGEYVSVSSQSDTENANLERERRELVSQPV